MCQCYKWRLTCLLLPAALFSLALRAGQQCVFDNRRVIRSGDGISPDSVRIGAGAAGELARITYGSGLAANIWIIGSERSVLLTAILSTRFFLLHSCWAAEFDLNKKIPIRPRIFIAFTFRQQRLQTSIGASSACLQCHAGTFRCEAVRFRYRARSQRHAGTGRLSDTLFASSF